MLQLATLATLHLVYPQAVAASVAVQDVGKHVVLINPICAVPNINLGRSRVCSLCVVYTGLDVAVKRIVRTGGVGEYYVPETC